MVNEDAPNGDAVVVVEMVVVMVLVAGAALPAVDVNVRLGVAPNPAKQLGVSVDDVVEVVEVMAPLKPPNKAGVLAAGADVVAMVETEGAAAVVAVTVPKAVRVGAAPGAADAALVVTCATPRPVPNVTTDVVVPAVEAGAPPVMAAPKPTTGAAEVVAGIPKPATGTAEVAAGIPKPETGAAEVAAGIPKPETGANPVVVGAVAVMPKPPNEGAAVVLPNPVAAVVLPNPAAAVALPSPVSDVGAEPCVAGTSPKPVSAVGAVVCAIPKPPRAVALDAETAVVPKPLKGVATGVTVAAGVAVPKPEKLI